MRMMSKIRIFLFFGIVLSGLTLPVVAQTNAVNAKAMVSTDQTQQAPAGKFIQDLGNEAIGIIADKGLTPEQRHKKYYDLLHQAFDMSTIGHFVLGRTWNTLTPEQQQEYMKLFEALVVKIYGDRLNLYSGETFRVKSVRSENDKDSIIGSEITHSDSTPPTLVDWRVRQDNGKLAVVDVVVEGVSQSVTQRQEYAAILQRNNNDFNALLNVMRQKVQQQNANLEPNNL